MAALQRHVRMLLARGEGIAEHSRATLAACSHTSASQASGPDDPPARSSSTLGWGPPGAYKLAQPLHFGGARDPGEGAASAADRGYRSQGASPRGGAPSDDPRGATRPASACGHRCGEGAADGELRRLAQRLQALPGRLPGAVKAGPAWEGLALQISNISLWQVRSAGGILAEPVASAVPSSALHVGPNPSAKVVCMHVAVSP